ncbi:MAG TPA: DUF4910 domain-containing protein [Acidimicrobiia bacterium]|jgi:aminopeptidase-like protein|nr:DUF4910 domain-containing protein [Acidimicrobiia bacterium]
MDFTFDRDRAAAVASEVIRSLFPTRRSITGAGNREALTWLHRHVPSLRIEEVPSGTEAFDWTIPPEWKIRGARLTGPDGEVVVDLEHSPLHVVGYSEGVDTELDLEELLPHLHSLPERPDAIPYRTSYYQRTWGFCLPHSRLMALRPGRYHAWIDAEHDDGGSLSYGEAVVGSGTADVILSAHICHPAQANDNLSGMAVLTAVCEQIGPVGPPLRALYLPGGIGSLAWLSRNEAEAHRVRGGLTLACLGDPAGLSFKRTRRGTTLVDRVGDLVARDMGVELGHVAFDPYGFDERNFSSPGFDLPFGSLTRSPHGGYPEYHSSDDSIDLMDADRLAEAAEFAYRFVAVMAANRTLVRTEPRGEPQLGKRGLYGAVGGLRSRPRFESALLWVANLADGEHDLVDVALRSSLPFSDVAEAADALTEAGVTQEAGQADSHSTSG